jgi:hypothetical protein
MVVVSSEKEGIWEPETLFRIYELLRKDNFRKNVLQPERRNILNRCVEQIRSISKISLPNQINSTQTSEAYSIRRLELYEDAHINSTYQPVELGDIFQVGQKYYILIAQPCDVALRSNGVRVLNTGTLVRLQLARNATLQKKFVPKRVYYKDGKVQVVTVQQKINELSSISTFKLEYYGKNPNESYVVKFREVHQISLDLLDLATFNSDGTCTFCISKPDNILTLLHGSLKTRYEKIHNHFKALRTTLMDKSFGSLAQHYKKAYIMKSLDSTVNIEYQNQEDKLVFSIKRVGRLKEPLSLQLMNEYFKFLFRNPQEHDFAKK